MGTVFGIEEVAQEGAIQQQKDGGSSSSTETEAKDYLSTDERKAIKIAYEILFECDGKIIKGMAAKYWPQFPLFAKTFEAGFSRLLKGDAAEQTVTSLDRFEQVIIGFTRLSSDECLSQMWSFVEHVSDVDVKDKHRHLFRVLLEIGGPATQLPSDEKKELFSCSVEERDRVVESMERSFVAMVKRDDETVDATTCTEMKFVDFMVYLRMWKNNFAPCFRRLVETFFVYHLFRTECSPSFMPFQHPLLRGLSVSGDRESAIVCSSSIATETELMPLAMYSDALQGRWQRLYTSATDGLSFNRVEFSILGYEGPTCFLIRCQDPKRTVIGAFVRDPWKPSNSFFGSSNSILFTLKPEFRILKARSPNNGHFQWLNTKSYTHPHGIGFGGQLDGFRLFIPDSLEGCTANSSCPTFEAGRLVDGDGTFEIDTLEIFGCGGTEKVAKAMLALQDNRESTDIEIQKARKVDKGAFFNNEFDREMFLGNTLNHHSKAFDNC